MRIQELLAHVHPGSYVYVCGHEVRYCQIAWHVVSMYSIVSSVTGCEITWFRSDGYDLTYRPNERNNRRTSEKKKKDCHGIYRWSVFVLEIVFIAPN